MHGMNEWMCRQVSGGDGPTTLESTYTFQMHADLWAQIQGGGALPEVGLITYKWKIREAEELTPLHNKPCGRAAQRTEHSRAARKLTAAAWIWLCSIPCDLGQVIKRSIGLGLNLENGDSSTYLIEQLWVVNWDKEYQEFGRQVGSALGSSSLAGPIVPWVPTWAGGWDGVYLTGSL